MAMEALIRTFVLLLVAQNVTPSSFTGFSGWTDYITRWQNKEPQKAAKLYPYGREYLDTESTVDERRNGFDPGITFKVPFYGVTYSSLYISIHGHVALSHSIPAEAVDVNVNSPWPNPQYPNSPDPPFIAPYYSKSDFRTTSPLDPSQIYYRTLRRATDVDVTSRIHEGMLEMIESDVHDAVISSAGFQATHALIVTWDQVTFSGASCSTSSQLDTCYRNTYQMALITDQVSTFVVLNYYNITWVGGPEQFCDSRTGRASDAFPDCRPAQAGFNAGQAREFTPLPYSQTSDIVRLDTRSGSTVEGRYFFDVTASRIIRGGCTNEPSLGSMWKLQVYPPFDGMLGGTEVNVAGPCFTQNDANKCRFGTEVASNALAKTNKMFATCRVPPLQQIGPIELAVSTDGGMNYRFKTEFVVSYMGHAERQVGVEVTERDWLNPRGIRITWLSEQLSSQQVQQVDINLHGFTVDSEGNGRWEFLHNLVAATGNIGYFDVVPVKEQCAINRDKCSSYDVGAIEVVLYDKTNPAPNRVWSDIIPLGWFTKTQMALNYGQNWAHERCRRWYSEDQKQKTWMNDLWTCPCTLQQALVDFGRFHTDVYCDVTNEDSTCDMHQGAVHCVRSIRTNSFGSGTQCCYERWGELMYSGDTREGSTPDRSHAWGRPPYVNYPLVPSTSHWIADLAPYYMCCEYQSDDYDCFDLYITNRLTQSCKSYTPSGHAAVFGDPHFRTFDGTTYTFNGYGEFWLVKTEDITLDGASVGYEIQARFQPPEIENRDDRATIMTSIAVRERGKATLEARMMADQYKNKIQLFLNKNLLLFPSYQTRYLYFNDLVVINNDAEGSLVRTNFTILYRSGLGLQVAYKSGLLHAIVSLQPQFKEHTFGLFGDWNGGPDDDLRPQRGGQTIPPDDLERVHNSFGWTWNIAESESLFDYPSQLTHGYYNQPDWLPNFNKPTTGMDSICQDNAECRYDRSNTGSDAIARDTLSTQQWIAEMAAMAQPVPTCGWLNVLNSIKKEPISYLAGSVVTITGCRHGFQLVGPTSYTCASQGNGSVPIWSPPVTTVCRDNTEAAVKEVRMAYAIGIPAGIVFLVVLILCCACCCYIRRKRRLEKERQRELYKPDQPANDEFFSDFHDIKSTPTKPSRPAYRSQVPNLDYSSQTHLESASRAQSLENLDEISFTASDRDRLDANVAVRYRVFPEDIDTSQMEAPPIAAGKKSRPPYQYPVNSETAGGDRKAAPYRYPRANNAGLTPAEIAIIEANAQEFEGVG